MAQLAPRQTRATLPADARLWMRGLRVVPAAHSGVFTVFLPISAAAVGVLALGEDLNGLQMAAFSIALLGEMLTTRPTDKPMRHLAGSHLRGKSD